MGAGASASSKNKAATPAAKNSNRARESQRHSMARSVEKFIINVYATCPRLEAMNLVLESKRGYQAFKDFTISERSSELVMLHQDIIALLIKQQNQYQLFKDFEKIIKKYIIDGSEMQVVIKSKVRADVVGMLTIDQEDVTLQDQLFVALEMLEDEVKKVMARDQFFRFIQSRYYKKWRAVESSHAMAHTVEDAIGVDIHEKGSETMKRIRGSQSGRVAGGDAAEIGVGRANIRRGSVRKSTGSIREVNNRSVRSARSRRGSVDSSFSIHQRANLNKDDDVEIDVNFAVSAFENVDVEAIHDIIKVKSWLSCLLPAVEALPICFTLSIARNSNKSFPYIFCNHYFEKVTGFESKDILGKPTRYIFCSTSEKDQIAQLDDALKTGTQATVIITTRTAENKTYKNLIVTRPIFTETKILKYIVFLYMDVSKETDDDYSNKSSLLNTLADMLPETILMDTIDDDEL